MLWLESTLLMYWAALLCYRSERDNAPATEDGLGLCGDTHVLVFDGKGDWQDKIPPGKTMVDMLLSEDPELKKADFAASHANPTIYCKRQWLKRHVLLVLKLGSMEQHESSSGVIHPIKIPCQKFPAREECAFSPNVIKLLSWRKEKACYIL